MLHQTDFDQKSKETEYSHLPVQPARLLEPGTHTAKEPEVTKIREVDNRRDTHRDIPGAIIIVIITMCKTTCIFNISNGIIIVNVIFVMFILINISNAILL